MFEPIFNQIKAKLEGISVIQEVHDYPTESFGGFPAAVVKSTGNESEFQSTTDNKRIYTFTVYLIDEIESENVRQSRRVIRGVVDDVMTSFDQDQLLSGVDLPNNESMLFVRPALSEIWEEPEYVVAELNISVMVQFNIAITG